MDPKIEKPEAIIVGGPLDNAGGNPAANPDPNAVAPAATEKKTYKTASGKEFATAEELQTYTSNLEEEAVRRTFANPAPQTPAPAAPQTDIFDELSQEIFTDPKSALKKVHEMGRQAATEEINKKDAAQRFWDDFYVKNPDLRKAERIVSSISRELLADPVNQKLSPIQGAELIAKEVRKAVSGLVGPGETREEVAGRPAPTLAGGTGPTQKVAPVEQIKPVSFFEQVKALRASKKA